MERWVAKVVLLGDGGVGKTSLVRRYVQDEFDDSYISTIGTKVTRKDIPYPGMGRELTMMLWDIHGQRSHAALHRSNYSGARGALLVFDVTRRDTFESMRGWVEGLREVTGDVPMLALCNKFDVVEALPRSKDEIARYLDSMPGTTMQEKFRAYLTRQSPELIKTYQEDQGIEPGFSLVHGSMIDELCGDLGVRWHYTSAKSGLNVERAFTELGAMLLGETSDGRKGRGMRKDE